MSAPKMSVRQHSTLRDLAGGNWSRQPIHTSTAIALEKRGWIESRPNDRYYGFDHRITRAGLEAFEAMEHAMWPNGRPS